MRKKEKSTEPTWNAQLVNIGMSQQSINDMTFKPGDHDFFIKMNDTFKESLTADIVDILEKNNEVINKDLAEIIVTQNERWSGVITEVMRGIEDVGKSIREVKTDMAVMKVENDAVHEELREGFKKLLFTNKWWVILLRLIATAIFTYLGVKYAHDHWWPAKGFLSILGL